MSMFTLALSCLTTSNLPWFMDPTIQVLMQYCSLQHLDFTSITNHIHNWVLFLLWLCHFILPGLISPLISSSILDIYWLVEFIFQCPIFLPFQMVHGVLKARILKWFAIPFSRRPHDVGPSTMTRPSWVALHGMAHSFFELDKAVVHVIRLVSFLWLWFSVCLPPDGEE